MSDDVHLNELSISHLSLDLLLMLLVSLMTVGTPQREVEEQSLMLMRNPYLEKFDRAGCVEKEVRDNEDTTIKRLNKKCSK